MNLDQIRAYFRAHTSSLAIDLDNASVDQYLNRAYQYTIPLDVGGEFSEYIWDLACVVDQDEYPYPEPMVSSSGKEPWIKGVIQQDGSVVESNLTYLTVETDPVMFERKYLSRSNNGRPTAVLFYGGTATLSSAPSQTFQIKIPTRSGPITPLDAMGIPHGTHARAVGSAAALEYLSEIQDLDDPGVSRENGLYTRYLSQLQTYALSRPMARRYARSF